MRKILLVVAAALSACTIKDGGGNIIPPQNTPDLGNQVAPPVDASTPPDFVVAADLTPMADLEPAPLRCKIGFADCNKDAADGCETTLGTVQDCAACGNACGVNTQCLKGLCVGEPPQPDMASSPPDLKPTPDLTPAPDLKPEPDMTPPPQNGCKLGFADCNNDQRDGCETSIFTDQANCGLCGLVCSGNHIAKPTCTGGICGGSCDLGWADCDGKPGNGCEANTNTDAGNCNGCGVKCPGAVNAMATCTGGICGLKCAQGFADCDNDASNGCEANLADPRTCGMCGNACSSNNIATPTCGAGACNGVCDKGYADCNSNKLADGCEINTVWDDANCGACGNVCAAVANGFSGCGWSTCMIFGCFQGYADCNGVYGDGCEVNKNTDTKNCGACGRACPNGQVCSAGTCTLACGPGLTNCFNSYCSLTASDTNNCGACGSICAKPANGSASCVKSSCSVASCDPGWGDCDGSVKNGCETALTADTKNCGACGNACPQGQACNGGSCANQAPPPQTIRQFAVDALVSTVADPKNPSQGDFVGGKLAPSSVSIAGQVQMVIPPYTKDTGYVFNAPAVMGPTFQVIWCYKTGQINPDVKYGASSYWPTSAGWGKHWGTAGQIANGQICFTDALPVSE